MSIDFKTELGKIKILMLKGEKGDAGEDGTSGDYSLLTNKPTINGITVDGSMTSDDLGLVSATGVSALQSEVDAIYPDFASVKESTSLYDLAGNAGHVQTYTIQNDGWCVLQCVISGATSADADVNGFDVYVDNTKIVTVHGVVLSGASYILNDPHYLMFPVKAGSVIKKSNTTASRSTNLTIYVY